MTTKKKTPIGIIIQWIMAVTGFLGLFAGLVGGSVAWGEFKAQQKEVTFENSAQKNDHINHVNEVPNVVENYKAMQQNIKIAKELDTALVWVQDVTQEYIEQKKSDSLNNADAVKSRAGRDSIMKKQAKDIEDMRREQRISSNAIQLILQKIDTIN